MILLETITPSEGLNDYSLAWISLFSGVLGSLMGAAVSWYYTRQHRLHDKTFSLHAEFNSEGMTLLRNKAYTFVPELFGKDIKIVTSNPANAEQHAAFWSVLNFYRRLHILVKHEEIDISLFSSLFGDLFTWWYVVSYCHMLRGTGWSLESNMHDLWKWFREKSGADPVEFSDWFKSAEEEVKKFAAHMPPDKRALILSYVEAARSTKS